MPDPTLPDLPAQGESNWYPKRAAYDEAIRDRLEGDLSPSELKEKFTPVPPVVPVVTDVLWNGAWPVEIPSGILRAISGWDPTATMPWWFTPGNSVGHMWVAHPTSLASL